MRRMAAILFIASGLVAQTNDPQALRQLGRDAVTHGDPDKAIEYSRRRSR